MKKTIQFVLNGKNVSFHLERPRSMLDVLREDFGFTSAKDGCSPQGQCGCCTILLNGKPMMSCNRDAESLDRSNVMTMEGMKQRKRDILAYSFLKTGGMQCGFCIPGISMRVGALLEKDPHPSDKKIRTTLQPHLCRCTGYIKLFDAVKEASLHWSKESLPPIENDAGVGSSLLRYQGRECVLGDKKYIDDMTVPDLLHGAVRLSDHPRARILSIKTEQALKVKGVKAILTANDIPGSNLAGLIEKDWPVFIPVGEVTHCVGSVLAAVAATSKEAAKEAATKIHVEYDVLDPITDPEVAIKDDADPVHPGRSNLLRVCEIKRGKIEEALSGSAHLITETFFTQRVEHAFLEPESALAIPKGDSFQLYTQGQGVHDDQKQIADIMDIPLEKIQVTLVSNGGAFGGKEDLSIQAHTVLLAHKTRFPVKLTLTREQSMRLHPKRHPIKMTYTVGCDKQGCLTGVKARMIGDTGAYASVGDKVMERAAGHSCGPYLVPNVDVEAFTVYTNNLPCGAFRGFGVNQAAFAMEGMLDRLAERVSLDPYQIRERNILTPGDAFATGQLMDESIGIRQCLEAVKPYFYNAKYAGIACGIKNTGIGNGMPDIGRVRITINEDGTLLLLTGFTEMGQGLFTILQQIVHEETGLPAKNIVVEVHSDFSVECGMTTASRATVLAGEATRRASIVLKQDLEQGHSLASLAGKVYPGEFICDFTSKPGQGGDNPVTHLTFGYAAQVVILKEDGTLDQVIAAHDVGKVMNRLQCEGQLEGAIHMGLGYALTEDLPCEKGFPVSTSINDLRILRARHIPKMKVILLEVPDPIGPYGAKGVGEIGLVPTAAATANALWSFDGIYRTKLPMRGSAAARAVLPKKLHENDHQ